MKYPITAQRLREVRHSERLCTTCQSFGSIGQPEVKRVKRLFSERYRVVGECLRNSERRLCGLFFYLKG